MARAHEIGIAADTKGFEQGIRDGVIDPLTDAEKSLDKLADAADDAGRDGARGIDRLEDALKDAQREAKQLGDAGDRAGDEVRRGMKRAEEGVDDFKQEAQSTAKESAASFDGSAESIVDAFQEIAANAFAGFGPAGVAAGLAAAGGIGLLVAAFDQAEDRRQALEERASSLAQAYIDAGTTMLDTITLASRVSEVITTPEQRAEAQKLADVLGIELPEAARILAGDTNALAAAQEVLTSRNAELNEQRRDGKLLTEEEAAALADQQLKLDGAADSLGLYAENNAAAAANARAYSDALLGMIADADTATEQVDALGNKLITLPEGEQILISAETGQATTNVEKFKGDVDGIVETVTTTARFVADTGEVDRQIRRISGTELRIKARVITAGGGWDE